MPRPCLWEVIVRRDESPWRDYTRTADEEQAGFSIQPRDVLAGLTVPPHLADYRLAGQPWLAVEETRRRVVVLGRLFGPLTRPDVTCLPPGARRAIGVVRLPDLPGGAAVLVRFLIRSQLVRTYGHLEAQLCLVREEERHGVHAACFTGHHTCYTQRREQNPLDFTLEIHLASGEMFVSGNKACR